MTTDPKALEFEWDRGNTGKNRKHKAADFESEEPFFDSGKVILRDVLHSRNERRFILLGKTKKGRLLYVAFTERAGKIRIISARDLNKREVPLYENDAQNT